MYKYSTCNKQRKKHIKFKCRKPIKCDKVDRPVNTNSNLLYDYIIEYLELQIK